MKKNIKISVIMSEYNTDVELLEKSIQSILNQTYKNFELIIIDDCGKNDVKKIVKKFNDNRIIVSKNKKNSGLIYSLNKAISLSKGEYIARMDTDDWSLPDRFEKQIKFIEKNPQYDIVSGKAKIYNEDGVTGETKFSGPISRKRLLSGTPIIHPTVMMSKKMLNKIGGYKNYNRCEDYALWINAYYNGYKSYVLDDFLIKYHLSVSDYTKRRLKTRKGLFNLIKKEYWKLSPTIFDYCKIYIKNFVAGILPYKIMNIFHNVKFKMER